MSADVVGYAYPWDAGSRMQRVLDSMQPTRMAVAALYHSVRAVDRSRGDVEVIDAWHSARYLPGDAWDALRIHPPAASWAGPDAFQTASEAIRAHGIPVDAWLVLNHLEHVAGLEEWSVVTATGRTLPYTQCPASPEVSAHMNAAVEAAMDAGADGIVLEAVASLGALHPVAHDKSGGARSSGPQRSLASWCFCERCRARRGEDGERHRVIVADALRGRIPAASPQVVAAESTLESDRIALAAAALRGVVAAARARGCARVAVFATRSARSFTPSAPLAAVPEGLIDVAVGSAWGTPQQTDGEHAALTEHASRAGHRTALSVNVLDDSTPSAPHEVCARWPVDEVHVYHLGLASDEDLHPWHRGASHALG